MWTLYAFRDKKSGCTSNYFVSGQPFAKVKQDVSISLLNLSIQEKTNPYVLFATDYDLVQIQHFPDEMNDLNGKEFVNLNELLVASRKVYDQKDQTSPVDELD